VDQPSLRDPLVVSQVVAFASHPKSKNAVHVSGLFSSPTPPSVADARKRWGDAKDKLTELRAAQTKLMQDEGEVAAQLEVSGINLRDCVRAVVRSDPATRELVDHLEIVRGRFVTLNSAVEFLAANGMTPDRKPPAPCRRMMPKTRGVKRSRRCTPAAPTQSSHSSSLRGNTMARTQSNSSTDAAYGAATVTVACKMPHGVWLQLHELVECTEPHPALGTRQVKQARKVGEPIMVKGYRGLPFGITRRSMSLAGTH
jgi:hypothetical protein